MEIFRYSPLLPISPSGNPSIRLVELQPRGTSDAKLSLTPTLISANLVDAHLDEGDPYEALSYCWGDASIKSPISLNGLHFEVTTNLYAALWRLQNNDRVRRIWIDAICVDQSNIDERNQQVHLMRRIYNSCSRCLVWLGAFSEDVSQGIDIISKIEEVRNTVTGMGGSPEDLAKLPPLDRRDMWCELGLPDGKDKDWAAFDCIFEAPWFRRVWIIQEITFPPIVTIICGGAELDWDETVATMNFARQAGLIGGPSHVVLRGDHDAFQVLGEMRKSGREEHLIQLLLRFRAFGASDKRDNIFALMSLQQGLKYHRTQSRSTPERNSLPRTEAAHSSEKRSMGSLMDRRRDKTLAVNSWKRDLDKVEKRIAFLKIALELETIAKKMRSDAAIRQHLTKEDPLAENEEEEGAKRHQLVKAVEAVEDPEHLLALLHRSEELATSINESDGFESTSWEETRDRILTSTAPIVTASLDELDVISSDSEDTGFLEPDYHLNHVEVYTITMDKLICISSDLGLLKWADPVLPRESPTDEKVSRASELPSWVVDWSAREEIITLAFGFSAARKSGHAMPRGEIDGRLPVQGHQFDTITHISAPSTVSHLDLTGWRDLAWTCLHDQNLNNAEIDEAFCHTIMGGILTLKMKGFNMTIEELIRYVDHYESAEKRRSAMSDVVRNRDTWNWLQINTNVSNICRKRRLAITVKGRISLVHETAQVGDELYLIKGGDVPFILRGDGDGNWRLGGHCYVHGVMFGECFEEEKCQDMILV